MPQRIDTPKKNRILGACEFSRKHGKVIPYTHIFEQNGISKSAGFRLLRRENGGRRRDQAPRLLTYVGPPRAGKGHRRTLTDEDVDKLVEYLETGGFEARTMNYKQLVEAAGLDVSVPVRTVQSKLAKRGFDRYPATTVDELPPKERKRLGYD